MPVIGFMSARSPEDSAHLLAAFRRGLAEGGFVEGSSRLRSMPSSGSSGSMSNPILTPKESDHAKKGEITYAALAAVKLGRGLRNDAEVGHGVGRMRLDLEPDAVARLRVRPKLCDQERHAVCHEARDDLTQEIP
jgi:hypothetical protein